MVKMDNAAYCIENITLTPADSDIASQISRPSMFFTGLKQHYHALKNRGAFDGNGDSACRVKRHYALLSLATFRQLGVAGFVRECESLVANGLFPADSALITAEPGQTYQILLTLWEAATAEPATLGFLSLNTVICTVEQRLAADLLNWLALVLPAKYPWFPRQEMVRYYCCKLLSVTALDDNPLNHINALITVAQRLVIPIYHLPRLLAYRYGHHDVHYYVSIGQQYATGQPRTFTLFHRQTCWPFSCLRIAASGALLPGVTAEADLTWRDRLLIENKLSNSIGRRNHANEGEMNADISYYNENNLQVFTSASHYYQTIFTAADSMQSPLFFLSAWELDIDLPLYKHHSFKDLCRRIVNKPNGRIIIILNSSTNGPVDQERQQYLRHVVDELFSALPESKHRQAGILVKFNPRRRYHILERLLRKHGHHSIMTPCSHHEKVVYLHDQENGDMRAFCGGIDFCFPSSGYEEHYSVDGAGPYKISYCGERHWRDFSVMLSGAAAAQLAQLQHELLRTYLTQEGELLRRGTFYFPAIALAPMQSGIIAVHNLSGNRENIVKQQIIRAILSAQKTIYLEQQYFRSDEMTRLLYRFLSANNHIQLVLIIPAITDEPAFLADNIINSRMRFAEKAPDALEDIVTISRSIDPVSKSAIEAQASNLNKLIRLPNVNIFFVAAHDGERWYQKPYVHSKVLIVDDATAIVGSANLNNRSLSGDADTEVQLYINHSADVKTLLRHSWQSLILEGFPHQTGARLQLTDLTADDYRFYLVRYDDNHYKADTILSQQPAKFSAWRHYLMHCHSGNFGNVVLIFRTIFSLPRFALFFLRLIRFHRFLRFFLNRTV